MRFLRLTAAAAALAALIAMPMLALAQGPSTATVPGPYNTDTGALITNSLRTAGTTTTAAQTNLAYKGVACRYVQTAASGSPSTTFSIQSYDAASASWLSLVTSGAITDTTVTEIAVYPGMAVGSLPAAYVAQNIHLPRVWRLSQTVAGSSGPAVTSKIGCNYLR